MILQRILTIIGSMVFLTVTGCGDSWKATTYPATGRVTINGKAPEGARVHLHPAGEKVDKRNSSPWGIVQKDGNFDLSTYEKGDGAPLGEYHVTLRWPFEPNKPDLSDRLGYAFVTPEKSKWKVTITEGENQLPPIEIENVRIKTKPSRSGQAPMLK